MFTEADLIVDGNGTPILVLPEHIPSGNNIVILREGRLDIAVDGRLVGRISGIDVGLLAVLSCVRQVGLCTYNPAKGDALPTHIQAVARVDDQLTALDFKAIA